MKDIKYKSFQVSHTDGLRELLVSSPIQGFKITTNSKQNFYFLPRPRGWKIEETIQEVEYQKRSIWVQSQKVYLDSVTNSVMDNYLIAYLRDYIERVLNDLEHTLYGLPLHLDYDTYYYKIPQYFYQVLQVILLIENLGLIYPKTIQWYFKKLNLLATAFNPRMEHQDAIPVRLDSEEALDKKFFSSESYDIEFF